VTRGSNSARGSDIAACARERRSSRRATTRESDPPHGADRPVRRYRERRRRGSALAPSRDRDDGRRDHRARSRDRAAGVRAVVSRRNQPENATEGYNGVRLTLARYLALALEFQLGADILSTAIAPTWDQIGKLGAIAVIRTALNFFLGREMNEEARRMELLRRSGTE
jgi:uncharacterized membrane protein